MKTRLAAMVRAPLKVQGAPFLLAALVIGALVGAAAALLVLAIGWLHDAVDSFGGWSGLGRFAPLIAVPIALLLAWFTARQLGPGIEGDGVPETMMGLSIRGGYLPSRWVPGKLMATILTLGGGGSCGREGPIVQIGATIGSSLARHSRFGEDQIRSLIAAGAGAGIGASFNAPIAGMLFAMEVILGNFSIRHLNAVVVASVAAAVTTRSIVGEEQLLSAPRHAVNNPAELILYSLLGLIVVAAVVAFLRSIDRAAGLTARIAGPRWVRPIVVGLIVAGLGILEPQVLGTGQNVVAETLRLTSGSDKLWYGLAALALVKIVASSATITSGGSGGAFMPSLFVGAAIGASFARLIGPLWGITVLEPGAFAVVGMAATFAAMARAPLTSILIVFEITGDYGLVLPLMLTASLATFLVERFTSDSVYTQPLTRMGIHLGRSEDIDLLDTVTVGEVMSLRGTSLDPDMAVSEAVEILDRERHHGLPVCVDDKLVGIVTLTDLAEWRAVPAATVGEAMTEFPVTVTPSMPVSAALARMAALGIGRLPVVADDDPQRLVGIFRRESVVRAYHHALGVTADRQMYRERLKQRTQPGAGFFEMPIPPRSAVHGKIVRELKWPEGATLVSVRRGGSVLIPHGDTMLRNGDTLTAFGTADSRIELAYMVEPTTDTIEMDLSEFERLKREARPHREPE